MRRADNADGVGDEQARVAATGVKAMIPIGRPFLDFVLSGLADAGVQEVCLVIGPEHEAVRRYYTETIAPARVHISFAIQERPLGTADAVTAAADCVGRDDFLVLNSDNYYPVDAFRALVAMHGAGLIAFERDAMVRESNVEAERARQFAIVRIASDDSLVEIIEKPDGATLASFGSEVFLSMNCWRFTHEVLDACRKVMPSARGELELPDAVRLAQRDLGVRFAVVRMRAGVLDLSSRGDISHVADRLAGVQVTL
jgi:dTDP-glucose pyrophosphorylase